MECKICIEKFDTENFKPLVCIPCGHTFCKSCVFKLNRCSICRAVISDKKPNYSLLEVLEESHLPIRQKETRSKPFSKSSKFKSNREALHLKNQGIKLNEEKNYCDALVKFEEALEVCEDLYPEKYSLLWWKANALKKLDNFDEAFESYKLALESAPSIKSKQLRNQIADCLKEHGAHLNKQKKYIESIIKLNEALEKYVTEDYQLKYSILWWKADSLKMLEKYDESLKLYNFALDIAPPDKFKTLKNQIAICYKHSGMKLKKEKKYDRAIEKFESAIDICTDDNDEKYSLFWWKAETLKENKMLDEALLFYEFALQSAPKEKKEEIKKQMRLSRLSE